MTSTYLSYRIYSADLTKSLQRVAAEPQNATDQKYFEANIGKVKSVDDFLNNYRLFTYAMKAYGLSDLGNAKALMRQVLTSDLSNPSSMANRLNDSRYVAFAKAFNFTTTGQVASTGQAQTNAQQQDLLAKLGVTGDALTTVQKSLAAVTSVSSFMANKGLYNQVLSAYGLDPKTILPFQVTSALESSLSDPNSAANRPDTDGSGTNAALRAIALDFNFNATGSVGSQRLLQSPQNMTATQTAYMSQIPSDKASQATANDESAYYAKRLPELTSVDQIVADPRIVSYLKTAFGLDPTTTTNQLRGVLTSNLDDAKSVANTLGVDPTKPSSAPTGYQLLASAFSIGTDGTAWDHSSVASTATLSTIETAYTNAASAAAASTIGHTSATEKAASTEAQTETDYFAATMPGIKSVSALLADSRLVSYLRTAFNLPAAQTSSNGTTTGTTNAQLGSILTSNLLDSTSVANTMGSDARKLAASFNFASDGFVYSQRPIQNASNVTATTTAYASVAGTSAAAKAAAQTETDYYTSTLPRIKNVDDLLANKRIVAYLTKAYNLPTTQTSTLRQVLTSNLLDPKSAANKLGGGYQTLAAAFDISSDGSITHAADSQAQSKTGIAATHAAYLEQAMETEAGADNDGVRLALYFKNKASTITNAYQILADKALTKVVQTMLGLSASSSNADIDSQAKTITSRLKLSDLKDPAKVDKMVARFAALYDLQNASSSSTSYTL